MGCEEHQEVLLYNFEAGGMADVAFTPSGVEIKDSQDVKFLLSKGAFEIGRNRVERCFWKFLMVRGIFSMVWSEKLANLTSFDLFFNFS